MNKKIRGTKAPSELRSAPEERQKIQREALTEPLASTRPLSKEEGRKMFDKALQIVAESPPGWKLRRQAEVAYLLRNSGLDDRVRELCEEVRESIEAKYGWSCVGPQHILGEVKRKVELAMGLKEEEPEPERRRPARVCGVIAQYLIPKVAYELAEDGDFEGALYMTRKSRDEEFLLPNIAQQMAKAGKFEDAIALASRIESPSGYFTDLAKSKIAMEMAKAGRFEQAVALSSQVTGPDRSKTQIVIATEMTKAGMPRKASELVSQITFLQYRTEAYAKIASELAKAGRGNESKDMFRKAQATLPKIEFDYGRLQAEGELAFALTRAFLATQTSNQDI
jgi:hypothetical protein